MKREDRLYESTREDIIGGKYGRSGDIFPPVRDFSSLHHCSLRVGVALYHRLEEARLLRLEGKRYYITSGFCKPDTAYGRLLSEVQTDLYGILINNGANPFFGELTNCLSDIAFDDGARVITADSNGDPEREMQIMDLFRDLHCRGVFSCIQIGEDQRAYFEAYPLPLVSLAYDNDLPDSDTVFVGNYLAGKQVAKHLLDCGCRSFAYVTLKNHADTDRRQQGFLDALRDGGHSLPADHIGIIPNVGSSPRLNDVSWFINRLLHETAGNGQYPVGIFCYHDLLAVEVERAVKHYRPDDPKRPLIPSEVMIVGFDDLPVASRVSPALTTVSYRCREIAGKAYAVMKDYVSNPRHHTKKYEIIPHLSVRESSMIKESQ